MINTNTEKTAPAALTVTGFRKEGRKTLIQFSDGSECIMASLDSSGYSHSEARRVFGRTTYLALSSREVSLLNATPEQWDAFEEDIMADREAAARQEENDRAEQHAMLEAKVEELRRDFTVPRIKALEKLREMCAHYGFRHMFKEFAPTI